MTHTNHNRTHTRQPRSLFSTFLYSMKIKLLIKKVFIWNSMTFHDFRISNSMTFPGLEFLLQNFMTFPGFHDLYEPCTQSTMTVISGRMDRWTWVMAMCCAHAEGKTDTDQSAQAWTWSCQKNWASPSLFLNTYWHSMLVLVVVLLSFSWQIT